MPHITFVSCCLCVTSLPAVWSTVALRLHHLDLQLCLSGFLTLIKCNYQRHRQRNVFALQLARVISIEQLSAPSTLSVSQCIDTCSQGNLFLSLPSPLCLKEAVFGALAAINASISAI